MWPSIESVLNPAVPLKDKVTYLNLINHIHKLRFEQDAEINFMKEKVQELISSPLTRLEGFLFMDALLTNHPTVYVHNWGPIIKGSLQCPDIYVSKQLTLRILTLVVVNFSGNSSCSEAFQKFIPEIVNLLLKVEQNDEGFVYCCRSLAICMQNMPAILGPSSEEIEIFMMKHMDSLSPDIIGAISDCFAAFPLCLGYFKKPKLTLLEIWSNLFTKTCNTVHVLLNEVLKCPGAENFVSVEDDLALKIPFDPNEEEMPSVLTKTRIFYTLCTCLAKMLSVHSELNYNTGVQVPVPELLDCLARIFRIKDNMRLKQIPKCSVLMLAYPLMQNAVLVVVGALIVNFAIVEHSGNVARLLKESIDVATLTTLTQSSLRQMRSTTWKTLNTWLKQYGAKGSYEIVNDRYLIQELLKDIALESEIGHSQANETVVLSTDTFGEECCFEALQVVQNIFTIGGSYMDKELVDMVSTTILKTAMKIQHCLHPAKKFPYPYTNENCRLKLYESLLSGSLFGDPLQTKYINQAINIFKIAMRDQSLEINTVCQKAFKLCRFFLNPKKMPPEALTHLDERKILPSQENVPSVWDCSNWDVNEQSQEAMETTPTCQIESVYCDGQRDSLPVRNAKSIHYSETRESPNQCNGDNSRIMSSKPSHSSICNDSGSEIEEYKEYSMSDTHVMLPVDIPPIAQTPIINSVDSHISEPKSTIVESKIIELKPAIPKEIANTNHESATDNSINCIDEVEVEMPNQACRNGVDVESEDEESGEEEDEDGTGSDEDEEVNEAYHQEDGYSSDFYQDQDVSVSDRCSPENYHERQIKRRKTSNEEHSSGEYEEEKSHVHTNQNPEPNQDEEVTESEGVEKEELKRSPSIEEMCKDFVLAEPEEMPELESRCSS